MKIEAGALVEEATRELGISLADLIALASVWISPELYRMLEPVAGVWNPDRRRANLGLRVDGKPIEAVGQVIDGVTLDSNTYANVAFKRALGVHRLDFVGFHVCHIWPATAYDPACYTNLANLVGIPAELSSLTDHHPHIVACLKFRAWELYHWKPAKELPPVKHEQYPLRWREPQPLNEIARRSASRRLRGVVDDEPDDAIVPATAIQRSARGPRAVMSGEAATEAAILIAFYLSKFEHERLRIGNQRETIDHAARVLGVNRSTLKNYRDYFDSHTGSRREGWKVPLPPQLASPFPGLMKLDEPTLRARVFELVGR